MRGPHGHECESNALFIMRAFPRGAFLEVFVMLPTGSTGCARQMSETRKKQYQEDTAKYFGNCAAVPGNSHKTQYPRITR